MGDIRRGHGRRTVIDVEKVFVAPCQRSFVKQKLHQFLRPARRRLNQLLGRDLPYRLQIKRSTLRLGSAYGGWVVDPTLISRDATVYTFGVGNDITFDLGLIEHCGVTVHAFDPTPKAVQWIKSHEPPLPQEFVFHNIGLANFDGVAHFALPRADWVSFKMESNSSSDAAVNVDCPVQRLSTIMKSLNHHHIDVLKMDIEGAEYDAIEDIVRSRIPIAQLLVEFHHTVGDRPSLAKTRIAIESLLGAGFRIFDVSPVGLEYSFINIRSLA